MIQTIDRFFARPAGMNPKDRKDRNPRNFNNGSNFNWRGIFLFVVYTSAVLGLFYFSEAPCFGSFPPPSVICYALLVTHFSRPSPGFQILDSRFCIALRIVGMCLLTEVRVWLNRNELPGGKR